MSAIEDFTDSELWIIRTTLEERYGEKIDPRLADTELRLNPYATELTVCPAAYWEHDGCHFIVCKTGAPRYRCQFYYRVHADVRHRHRGIRRPVRMHGDTAAGTGGLCGRRAAIRIKHGIVSHNSQRRVSTWLKQ